LQAVSEDADENENDDDDEDGDAIGDQGIANAFGA